VIAGGTPQDLDTYFKGKLVRWKKAITDAGIKPE